jgi:hypothetical protein
VRINAWLLSTFVVGAPVLEAKSPMNWTRPVPHVLYRLVREHFETFVAHTTTAAAARDDRVSACAADHGVACHHLHRLTEETYPPASMRR